MSGPIIRKYGFANFEKIFGERELKHGVVGEPSKPESPAESTDASPPGPSIAPPTSGTEPSKKTDQ